MNEHRSGPHGILFFLFRTDTPPSFVERGNLKMLTREIRRSTLWEGGHELLYLYLA